MTPKEIKQRLVKQLLTAIADEFRFQDVELTEREAGGFNLQIQNRDVDFDTSGRVVGAGTCFAPPPKKNRKK